MSIDEPPPGVRTRKKDRTREALSMAAVQLFAERGYEATTVEQVTERAQVSPRTFFRYFGSKADVLLPLDQPRMPWELITEQPAELSDIDAARAAFVVSAPAFDEIRPRVRLLRQALSSSAALRGRDADQRRVAEDDLAAALARRRQLDAPDRHAALAATVVVAVIRRALDRWLEEPDGTPLVSIVEAEFDLLTELS